MATDVTKVRYSERQFLGAADFRAEQAYHRDARRRHALGPHTWGIVVGLELVEVPDPADAQFVDLLLRPGVAVDGYGREIVLYAALVLDAVSFEAFAADGHRALALLYDEDTTRPPADGYADCREGEPTRTVETWRLVVDQIPERTVLVDGLEAAPPPAPPGMPDIAVDLSVPYQELPEEPPLARWHIPLGSVRWDGTVHRFRPAAAGKLTEGRVYGGAVADHVLSPTSTLRVARRAAAADVDAAPFATVEGRLTAKGRLTSERELWMEGDPIRFTHDGGTENNVPITLGRQVGPALTGEQLRLRLGDDASAATTDLSIGTGTGASAKTVIDVKASGVVEIPEGLLDFGHATRQMIDLWSTGTHQYGIGVQSGTLYLRTAGEVAVHKGGVHDDAARAPGAAGQLQLYIDGDGNVNFGHRTRQMLDLWATSSGHQYGIGVQSHTLYHRSEFDFCWFRRGSHVDVRSSPGGGGTLAMRLDDQSQLEVFGNLSAHGDATIGAGGNGRLRVRHVDGKGSSSDLVDDLFLNWDTGKDVFVGRSGNPSDLTVTGSLRVEGPTLDSVIRVRSYPRTVMNNGDAPGAWSLSFGSDFDSVYAVYVALTGFSVTGELFSANPTQSVDAEMIPQHAWVIVDTFDRFAASGRGYLAQSLDGAAANGNNQLAFTVVAIGRKWT